VNQSIKSLYESPKAIIDMHQVLFSLIFGIMGNLVFGGNPNSMENAKIQHWTNSLSGFPQKAMVLAETLKIRGINRFAKMIIRIAVWHYGWFIRAIEEKVNWCLETPSENENMIHYFQKPDSKSLLSRPEIQSAAVAIMFAGTATSPKLLAGLIFLLLKHPDSLLKVVSEVRSTFGSTSSITMKSTSSLEYLSACIQETLRIYPPVAGGIPRVVPRSGALIAGNWVPARTVVYVSPLSASGPANFSDAEHFNPNRWLSHHQHRFPRDQREAMKPFSAGPRDCIGKAFVFPSITQFLNAN
jgi:cytochrome P450